MRIKGIDFPEELLEAQRQKNLVVFAGAGVSMGPPANYPSFNGLVKDIAEWAHRDWPKDKHAPPEHFLGRLAEEKINVHEQVVIFLSNPDSKHKKLHENLLQLFSGPEQVRIVTTNFDSHFESAAEKIFEHKPKPEIFCAPALPLGNDFSGIVYLHGSVKGVPRKLVLTDQDFGRAYLTEGWATRFLQAMFFQYTVLFVGYRHGDTVMHYLSRGLPPETAKRRFALIRAEKNSSEWGYRGITPLPFPFKDQSDYSQLSEGIAGWEQHANRGNLDTEQRIKDLVTGASPLNEEDQDFLKGAIKDDVAIEFFFRHAKGIEWLTWVEKQEMLSPLFEPVALPESEKIELPGSEKSIEHWVAKNFIIPHSDLVLSLIAKNNNKTSPLFAYAVVSQLAYVTPLPDKKLISQWVPVLLRHHARTERDKLAYTNLLQSALKQEAFEAAVLLFEYLTRPHLRIKKRLSLYKENSNEELGPDMALEFIGDDHSLNEIWENRVQPNLSEFAIPLLQAAILNLNHAYQLLESWQKVHPEWDPLSWSRSSIALSEKNQNPETKDILINAARDCLEWLLQHKPSFGLSQIEILALMEPMIMKRLALHGVNFTSALTADEKVNWLLQKDFIPAHGLRQEIFQVLENAYPTAGPDLKRTLLNVITAKIDALPEKDRQSHIYKVYEKYNYFQWLSNKAPECREAAARLDSIKKEFPEFQPRESPGLDHWHGKVIDFASRSPLPVEALLKKRPAEQLNFFMTYKQDESGKFNRRGLLFNIAEAVHKDFIWGKELAEELNRQTESPTDLWNSTLQAWNNTKFDAEQWDQVLSILDNANLPVDHAQSISTLLERSVEENGGIPLSLLSKADHIAKKTWLTLKDNNVEEMNDWLLEAINHPGGKLTLFWLHALSRTRREKDQKGKGLIEPFKDRFEEILFEKTEAAVMGRIILVSQLEYLYTVDPAWTKKNLIPLLDWDKNTQQAKQAWDAWLQRGRINEPLLYGLIPLFKKSFSYLSTQLQNSREHFAEWVAHIAVFWMNDPLDNHWLPDFFRKVEEQDRIYFASRMRRQLKGMEPERKIRLWERWLKKYWESRNQRVPVPLSDEELIKTVEWIDELEPVFPEVVDIICKGGAPSFKQTQVFRRLAEGERLMAAQYPLDVSKLLIHLTSSRSIPRYFCDDLEKLTEQLISTRTVPAEDLRKLCENLSAIGCDNALKLSGKINTN